MIVRPKRETAVEDLLAKFNGGELIAFVAVAGGLLCGILCGVSGIIMGSWEKIRRAEIAAALKRDMLNRGMSADEIRTVIDAGTKSSRKERRGQHVCNE
jgi:hypothetical protein